MLKILKTVAVIAITVVSLASCSGPKELDVAKVKALTEKSASEWTADDTDFCIDQIEVFADATKGMTKEEVKAYVETLSDEQQEALLTVGLLLAGAQNSGALTPDQLERLAKLEAESK